MVTFKEEFTPENIYRSARLCLRGVRWKSSVLNFERHLLSECALIYRQMMNGTYKIPKSGKFTIDERGKKREISAIPIRERTIEKTFCKYILYPNIKPFITSSNCAVLPNRGTLYCIRKVRDRTSRVMRKYKGCYVLITDFHHYFESIDHKRLFNMMSKYLDEESMRFYKAVIGRMKGLELGSEISQLSAVFYATELDRLGERISLGYIRYMDDTISFYKTKESARRAFEKIKTCSVSLGLEMNERKCRICKADDFSFLKKKFVWNGKRTLVIPLSESLRRMKRKIGKWKRLKLEKEQVEQSFNGWKASFSHIDGYYFSRQGYEIFKKAFQNHIIEREEKTQDERKDICKAAV